MDRRAAGALLALAACFASSAAAPTAGNHTALDLYEGTSEGCYYNFQHYGEGDRIMTNEPCLNCTCHNRMLMCYLRVCPFTKPIGQDCTVEKRADQCCPIITCPDVPVDLLTSTSTSSPAEYGATGLGKLDKYGCSINGKYFSEGSKVPPTPNKPCEHCYCIRNMTTCVMQECTLHVDGCTPIYHKDVCCPIRYSCDHPEDELPLLDDMSTTVRPTPGFLLTTTTLSPVTQMTQDCVHNDRIIADGASITTEKACEHCYCMKGDIVCVVQECGAPMENEGKNCTSLPPRDGQCCPDTYICEGDELSTEISNESTTESILEKLTTLSPPRRSGVEGSGYRNEPNEATYTEEPSTESHLEGSGEELETTKLAEEYEPITPEKPSESNVTPNVEESDQYLPVTTKAPAYEESESSTKESDENIIPDALEKETIKPQGSQTPDIPEENVSDVNTELNLPDKHVTTAGTAIPASYDQFTTELIESLNTVPDISPEKDHEIHHEYTPISGITAIPPSEITEPAVPQENLETEGTPSMKDQDVTLSPISEFTFEPEYLTPIPEITDEIDQNTTEKTIVSEQVTQKEKPEDDLGSTTSSPVKEEEETPSPDRLEAITVSDISSEKDANKSEQFTPSTTNMPLEEIEKLTTEPNHAQNTVIVAEEDSHYPHITTTTEKVTASDIEVTVTETNTKVDVLEPEEHVSTVDSVLKESESTAEPDKGLNTIPSEIDEQPNAGTSLDVTTSSSKTKATESPMDIDKTNLPKTEESSTSTPILDSHVTKVDSYTVTTEPSFRKEDESSISTEKTREEFGPTTIKAEFVDEGLIPTSGHDDKLSTGSNTPSTDEEITTIMPEYNKEPEEAVTIKQSTTESLPETSVSSGTLPGKIAENTDEPESNLSSSTEKSVDVTVSISETHEEPSRIPGEGDCLLNGVTYKNNTIVPSTNNCLTGCKCVSSIVKCDPIICSPPPDYMSNCQSIFDTPDSCCPTYVCDHPRETIPPQSDNQMSGTEVPIISPTIECRGDQCELSVATKPTEPSEHCTSGSCLSAPGDKTGTKECGPDGCDDSVKESVFSKPSIEQSECVDGKCESHVEEDCTNGKCQILPTHNPAPVEPCNGLDCKISGADIPVPQHCENGHDCKENEVPATQTVTDVNCGNNDCESGAISPSQDSQPEPCNEKDGCKPEEISPSVCTGDEPCRRKDSPITQELPPKCEGNDCVEKSDTSITENLDKFSTASPISEETPLNEVTEKTMHTEEEKGEPTGTPSLEQKLEETTPIIHLIPEQQHVPTEYTIHVTTDTPEETSEIQENITNEPSSIEKEGTKSPDAIQGFTDTPVTVADVITARPDDTTAEGNTPNLIDDQRTQTPDVVEISTPSLEATSETILPVENDKEEKDKQVPVEEEVTTKIPIATDEYTHKSTDVSDVKDHSQETTLVEESGTQTPGVTEEYSDNLTKIPDIVEDHNEPTMVDSDKNVPNILGEYTNEPLITEEVTKAPGHVIKYTDIPHSIVEQETKKPDKEPVITAEEESTKIPKVTEEHSDHLTEIPDVINEHPDEAIKTEESSTKTADIIEKDTDKPIFVTEKDTEIPDDKREPIDKLSQVDEEGTKIPTVTEEYYDKPTETPSVVKDYTHKEPSANEFDTESPGVVEEQSYVPVFITEDGTESPDYGLQHSDKPTVFEGTDSKIPDNIEQEPEDELTPVKEQTTRTPEIIKEYTDVPIQIPDVIKEQTDELPNISDEQTSEPTQIPDEQAPETTNLPDIIKEQTDEPARVQDSSTKLPDVKEEQTQIPVLPTEESTKTPYYEGDNSDQSSSLEENDKKTPYDHDNGKEKPNLQEEEFPEKSTDEQKPDFIEKDDITESAITGEDGTENPDAVEDSSTTKPALIEEPAVVEVQGTDDLPIVTEETSTDKVKGSGDSTEDKPSTNKEHSEKPTVVIEDYTPVSFETAPTDKPEIFNEQTIASESPEYIPSDENPTGTTAPQIYFTESEKEVKLPESSIKEHTENTDMVTQVPTYESNTTESEESLHTESYLAVSDINKPGVTSSQDTATSPEVNDLDSSMKEPHGSSTGVLNEVTTEVTTKLEKTTEVPVTVTISENTLPPLREEEQITPYQEPLTNEHEAAEKPGMIMTTESIEKITKTSEHDIGSEQEEGYTGMPEQVPSTTKSPVQVTIEPQEGGVPESPDLSQAIPADVETATKLFEDNIKSTVPESHVTDSLPEYEGTSKLPEIDRVTDFIDSESQKPQLPEQEGGELESIPTKAPTGIIEDDVKTNRPDIYTPEKEEMITTTTDSTGTLAPMKGFTESYGSLITDEEQTTTRFNQETTERAVSTTKKIEESSESSSSKTTNAPEESYTKSHEGFTDAPILEETKPSEINEAPTTSKSPVLFQETPDSGKPLPEEPNRRNEMPFLENITPQATELPVALVTESDEELIGTIDDVAVHEEKTTKTPEPSIEIHSDAPTILPETYITEEPVATEKPEPNEPASLEPEQSKTTESSYTDAQFTDDQETGIKHDVPELIDVQKTTTVPELSDTLGPQTETEVQKPSTESSATLVEAHTDLPPTQVTPEASLSLVTEYQPDSVTVEKQDHTDAVLQDSHTVAQEQTTEREDVATLLHEITTIKQLEVTKPADKTSAQVETETTPYLIELEEHTHKMVDESSTIIPVDEKVPIYETGEDISTSTPSKEEHTPAQDLITPSTSEEEHTFKLEEHLSTISTSAEDYTHKIPEEISPASPSAGEATTEREHQDSDRTTEKIPEREVETATKQSEILSGSSEETSTTSGVVSYQTTLSVPKDTDTIVEDGGVAQKNITTSKQSQDFETTTPVTFADTEKAPISESHIKVPTKEESPHSQMPSSSDKTTTPEDELVFSTPKSTTVKQEELLTPSSEDKYNPPEEKPTSEALLPNATAEIPKPASEIEPTEEIPAPEDEGLSPSVSGYGEPDYGEEDQAFGPGTCRYGGKVYVSAQQIPRDDPCDFCFCFRSDIICLQQSCPPPIHGCHEEPIQGFCCPRYECPVSMATSVNVTTTTTTTTTTLPPHFPTHGYKGAAQRRGCQIKGHTYKVGEVVRSSSGPCLHCTCGGDGQMKCDPKACTPEPMLRQMIAAAVSAKRRR